MEKKLCVFLPETDHKVGDSVYWFDHPNTEDAEFNGEHVRIYSSPSADTPFLRCHICQIKEVELSMIERKWGGLYLKDEFSQFK